MPIDDEIPRDDDAIDAVDDIDNIASAPCQGDIAYQAPVDSAVSGRAWIDAALAVLTTEFDRGKPGSIEESSIRDLCAAAAQRAVRELNRDIDGRDD